MAGFGDGGDLAGSKRSGPIAWAVFAVGCLALGGLSGLLSGGDDGRAWYDGLTPSPLTPPGWVFPVVWTLLYLMMGTAAWRVWSRYDWRRARAPLALFALQLAVNLAWTPAFFGLQSTLGGVVVIIPLVVLVGATTVVFWVLDKAAGLLMAPYCAWVLFATAVAWQTFRLNP